MSPKLQYWTFLLYVVVLLPVYGVDELAGDNISKSAVEAPAEELVEDLEDDAAEQFLSDDDLVTGKGKDIVLVLDNSVSMKKNDPDFLLRQASIEFINKLGEGDRIAVIIFDQDVSLTLPLTNVFDASREHILTGLNKLNYQGLFTDSPAAIERGLYELRNNGRESVQKVVIFITDSSVDTGDVDVDQERTRSLEEELKDKDTYRGIRFYGIGLTEDADQLFLQTLVDKLEGEAYLVREALELESILLHIDSELAQYVPPEPLSETDLVPEVTEPEGELVVPVVEEPVRQQAPVQNTMAKEERTRSIIIIVSAVILMLALVAIIVLLVRRNRDFKAVRGYEVEAYLNDYHGYTGEASYKLDAKPTMLGRVAGKDSQHLNFIVIPESTIGRRHALIDYKDYGYWISDQGSINGTFVNDKHITSEMRLKHGDKVRLHKYEFEFIMPETSGAGATVVSSTSFSEKETAGVEAEAVLQEVQEEMSQAAAELDFDFSSTAEEEVSTKEAAPIAEDSVDETLMPSQATIDDIENNDTQDETLLPGTDSPVIPSDEPDIEDETLMPGTFEPVDELEGEQEADTSSYENFFDLTGDGEEDKKE